MTSYVVGLDLAKSAALAAAEYPDGPMGVTAINLNKVASDDPRDLMAFFAEELDRLLDFYRPIAVAYEDPGFHVKAAGQLWIRRQEGVLLVACARRELLCVGLHSSSVKAHAWKHGARKPPPKSKKGAQKAALLEAAVERGWVPIASKKYEDQADASWVADALRRHDRLIV